MLKNIYFMLVILLVGLPLLSATQVYKQYDTVDLKVQCIANGTFCSSGSYCNITVTYPNGSMFVNNQKMTNQTSFYNYTIQNSNILGDYSCMAVCCDGILCATDNSECPFKITPTGDERGIGLFLILLICGFVLFALDYFIETGYITFLSGIIFVVTGMYSMIYGVGDLSEFYTRVVALICVGIGVIFIIGSAYDLVWGEGED